MRRLIIAISSMQDISDNLKFQQNLIEPKLS